MNLVCFKGDRGSGKTIKLIRYAVDNNLTIVCLNHDLAYHTMETARIMKEDGLINKLPNFPITYEELNKQDDHNTNGYAFDEFEEFIKKYLFKRIDKQFAITFDNSSLNDINFVDCNFKKED